MSMRRRISRRGISGRFHAPKRAARKWWTWGHPAPGDGPTERPVDLDAFAVAKFNDDEADFPSVQAIRTGIPAEIVKINPHRQHPVLAFELAMVRLADQAYLVDPLCITPRRPV